MGGVRGRIERGEAAVICTGEASVNHTGGHSFNSHNRFNLANPLNDYFGASQDSNPYIDLDLSSLFVDPSDIHSQLDNKNKPIILNINIQSLYSKFESLKNFTHELTQKGVFILAISLQEVWKIVDINSVNIEGFTLYLAERKNSRGGGGWYIYSQWILCIC